jgi:hypothetical protein
MFSSIWSFWVLDYHQMRVAFYMNYVTPTSFLKDINTNIVGIPNIPGV